LKLAPARYGGSKIAAHINAIADRDAVGLARRSFGLPKSEALNGFFGPEAAASGLTSPKFFQKSGDSKMPTGD
jgi:hypothetical protein